MLLIYILGWERWKFGRVGVGDKLSLTGEEGDVYYVQDVLDRRVGGETWVRCGQNEAEENGRGETWKAWSPGGKIVRKQYMEINGLT